MSLSERVTEMVRACFTGLWITTHEADEALQELAQLCRAEDWRFASWDIHQGLLLSGQTISADQAPPDPLTAVRYFSRFPPSEQPALLVLTNFHRFLSSAEVVQALAQQILAGKQRRTFLVILSPVVDIPVELEKLLVVLQHELPDREQLLEIARGVATEAEELPGGLALERVLDAAAGLTRYEAEGAFALSLVRDQRIEPATLWELKSQALLKSGLLTLHRSSAGFAQLGGLESLKTFALRALRSQVRAPECTASRPRARGVMLLGVPGTGKSAFCKALGAETGRPTLVLDIGSLMGSLVGQSEERTRQALRTIDAMAPCIAFIDEVDKALGGVMGPGDSGVSARLFGTVLSWLNDHESDVFVVCTANDVSRLPPEFSRSERFDGTFFLDLPGPAQRAAIWQQYLAAYQLDAAQRRPDDSDWTGAEIKSCCRLAALLDVPLVEAAHNVVPVAITAAESVARLRTWAQGRCLDAERPGIYRAQTSPPVPKRRRVDRSDPSVN